MRKHVKKIPFGVLIIALVLLNIYCEDNQEPLTGATDLTLSLKRDSANQAETAQRETLKQGKHIYLTIDDAPVNGCNYVDSVIANKQVKTSIFLVGNAIDGSTRFRKYFNAMTLNPYIEIYNHSYSHGHNRYAAFYKNPQAVLADFEKNRMDFNLSHKIARLPAKNLWMVGNKRRNCKQTGATSAQMLVQNGYNVFGWDVEWHYEAKDYVPKQTVDELVEEIEKAYYSGKTFEPNHVVLLLHNQMFGKQNSKNDLAQLITLLQERNYSFEYLRSFPQQAVLK